MSRSPERSRRVRSPRRAHFKERIGYRGEELGCALLFPLISYLYVAEGGTGGATSTVGRCRQVPDAGPAYDRYRDEVGSGWESSLADLKAYLEGPRRRRIMIEAGLPEN